VALAGCSKGGSKGGTQANKPITLNVSLMKGSAPDSLVAAVSQQMHAAHPNVTVKVQILDWTGRDAKWQTALLANPSTIDVLEQGNTDVLTYAANGSLADLSNYAFENKDSWLTALKDAGTYNGKLYGVPYYAGSRVVWFNQDMWKAAGLPDPTASPPATLADLQKDAQKIMAKVNKPDFSGLYFPGKYWYGAISFVYDTGGSIATSDSSGKWTGNLNSAQSQQGLNNWLNFVKAVSKAPANGDETKDTDIIGQGKTAMIYDAGWAGGVVTQKYKNIKLGAFPMPGTQGGLPVFLGGSNFAVAAHSANKDLAADYIKIFTDNQNMAALAATGAIPNTTNLLDKVPAGPPQIAAKAANRSWFTPTSPRWAKVENNNVLQNMLVEILTGKKSVADATKDADNQINSLLQAS
jgi:N,N'-diacetylchitobiose transport system substrate-binding protein